MLLRQRGYRASFLTHIEKDYIKGRKFGIDGNLKNGSED
jgi:hypothetical protein